MAKRRTMGKAYAESSFYCINCGKKGTPIQRKTNKLRTRGHHKKLYCPWCQEVHNAVEIRTYGDLEQFEEDFASGVFIQEIEEEKEKGVN